MPGEGPREPHGPRQRALAGAHATWVGETWEAIRSALHNHPESVALALVVIGLVVRPKGTLATVWWSGTGVGSLIALWCCGEAANSGAAEKGPACC